MKIIYIALLYFISIFSISCNPTNKMGSSERNIKKNTKTTKKVLTNLYEINGISFYISSTHSAISFVWSYSSNELKIYKLLQGKIIEEKVIPQPKETKWIEDFSGNEIDELSNCIELDGDMFGFKLRKDGRIMQQDMPINLSCFARGIYKSEFLDKIAKDINTYNITW